MAQPAASDGSLSPATPDQVTPRASKVTPESQEYSQQTPRKSDDLDLGNFKDGDEELSTEMDSRQQMELEKGMYPGASTWAKAEERLFEILFLRQNLPLLPSHWDVDFRGVPISVATFNTTDESPPIVYAHSKKEFQATMALTRLIDLTSSVRTTSQSGLRQKTPTLIKKGLDSYLSWAAQDGEYSHLRVVPNIVTEVIDLGMDMDDITEFMQLRMKDLAQLQRDFLRVDRVSEFWTEVEPKLMDSNATMEGLAFKRRRRKMEESKRSAAEAGLSYAESCPDKLATESEVNLKADAGAKKRRIVKSPTSEVDELVQNHERGQKKTLLEYTSKPFDSEEAENVFAELDGPQMQLKLEEELAEAAETKTPETSQTPHTPQRISKPEGEQTPELSESYRPSTLTTTASEAEYRRGSPVVYGLFILNTSVFLLTVDSAKGEDGYVSFHLEMDFLDRQQSVWNALTIAIATCLARDELCTRLDDFEDLPVEEESDPDV